MNWRRLYATTQIYGVIGGVALGGAGCWSFLVAGICRVVLGLGDTEVILLIGLPLFIVLFAVFVKYLPKTLGKSGMLSDDPKKFGPWFK